MTQEFEKKISKFFIFILSLFVLSGCSHYYPKNVASIEGIYDNCMGSSIMVFNSGRYIIRSSTDGVDMPTDTFLEFGSWKQKDEIVILDSDIGRHTSKLYRVIHGEITILLSKKHYIDYVRSGKKSIFPSKNTFLRQNDCLEKNCLE